MSRYPTTFGGTTAGNPNGSRPEIVAIAFANHCPRVSADMAPLCSAFRAVQTNGRLPGGEHQPAGPVGPAGPRPPGGRIVSVWGKPVTRGRRSGDETISHSPGGSRAVVVCVDATGDALCW